MFPALSFRTLSNQEKVSQKVFLGIPTPSFQALSNSICPNCYIYWIYLHIKDLKRKSKTISALEIFIFTSRKKKGRGGFNAPKGHLRVPPLHKTRLHTAVLWQLCN